MRAENIILKVAIPGPFPNAFDYLPPEHFQGSFEPGARLEVEFGRRKIIAFLVEVVAFEKEVYQRQGIKLKRALRVLDKESIFDQSFFSMCRWAADYYHHPLGDVLSTALPVLLRKGKSCEEYEVVRWRLSVKGKALQEEDLGRARKQKELFRFFQEHDERGYDVSEQLIKQLGFKKALLDALESKGLIEKGLVSDEDQDRRASSVLSEVPLVLNKEQLVIEAEISRKLKEFSVHLIDGVTGSGKTEVYFHLIEKVLLDNKQVLFLVPEIGLTPQTVQRFEKRFCVPVVVMHSAISDRQKLLNWVSARKGHGSIILGTRSAVFTPMRWPGMIVIDEEHDGSYKQKEGFRYSARDMAIYRARQNNIPVVMGSATPALESIHNVLENKYSGYELNVRAGGAAMPDYVIRDIKSKKLIAGIDEELMPVISHELDAGNQVMVFINRRGFAPVLLCHDCGWIANCKQCDVRYTYHQSISRLICHHCLLTERVPMYCPDCGASDIRPVGYGTERIETELQEYFPKTLVQRIDRDTTRKKGAMENLLKPLQEGRPAILLGTQMLAKGHHFPKIALVIVLDIDAGMLSSDFRASESTAQLLVQVAGRAGRESAKGKVIIQTHYPDDLLLQMIVLNGYRAFARLVLEERRLADMPPYGSLALLRAESFDEQEADVFLGQAKRQLADIMGRVNIKGVQIMGPAPAPLARKAGKYRSQLLVCAKTRQARWQLMGSLLPTLETTAKLRWSLEIDPVDLY